MREKRRPFVFPLIALLMAACSCALAAEYGSWMKWDCGCGANVIAIEGKWLWSGLSGGGAARWNLECWSEADGSAPGGVCSLVADVAFTASICFS